MWDFRMLFPVRLLYTIGALNVCMSRTQGRGGRYTDPRRCGDIDLSTRQSQNRNHWSTPWGLIGHCVTMEFREGFIGFSR